MSLKSQTELIARLLVGGVLIYAGASKVLSPTAEFAAALSVYRVLPNDLLPWVARVWPWLELLTGTYLFFGYYTRLAADAAASMFLIFLGVLVSAMVRGIDPSSCGCFGMGLRISVRYAALFDAILLIGSLFLATRNTYHPPYSADSWINK